MDFNLTEEQQMLREGVRRFASESYPFEARRRVLEGPLGFSAEHWQTFAELGWLALGLPEDVGGLGFSFLETTLVMEELGRALAPEPFVSTAVLGSRIIDRSGVQSLRSTLLPQIAEGKLRLALAHSEAKSRYNLAAVSATRARSTDEGYVIDGTKTLVVDAPSAHQLIVSAATEEGFILLVVPRDAAGVRLQEYRLIDGSLAADVEFRGVRVPKAALLAQAGRSLELLAEAVDRAILAAAAEAVGAMEGVLEITNAYLKQRVQFGQTIGKFQALQHRMAEMFVELQESRSILYRGLSLIDASAPQRKRAISATKVVVSHAAKFVGSQGIQLHGGIGMTEEYAVGHYYKKLICFEKRFGDSEYHLERYQHNGAG